MTRIAFPALALLLAASPAFCQNAPAPAGQTPQAGVPGAAPTQAAPASSTPQGTPSAAVTQRAPRARQQRGGTPAATPASPASGQTSDETLRLPKPASTAPIANSNVVISGSESKIVKPTDDHPLLPMDAVGNPLGIRSGTPIHIQLDTLADSGHLRNGDLLHATLAAPLAGLVKGTPVQLTVVQSAQAGSLTSAGELSLQVTRIGNYSVLSVIVTALGKEGKKELADAAPAIGTEAEFPANQDLSFPAA